MRTTSAPAAAPVVAIAAPMPLPAPVTTTTRPSNVNCPSTRVSVARTSHDTPGPRFTSVVGGPIMPFMARMPVRNAALQVGEFAVGVVAAYAAVGAAWSLSHSIWPLLLATAAVVAIAVVIEVRYGAKATGLVVGLLPTSVMAAGLL